MPYKSITIIMMTQNELNKEAGEKGKETINRIKIENTPFNIVTYGNNQFGEMGKYRVTEPLKFKNEKERKKNELALKNELKKITWNRLIQVVSIIIQETNLIKK